MTDGAKQVRRRPAARRSVVPLAAAVAHDVNNLLAAILGAAEAIAGRGGLDPDMLEDIGAIRTSAVRAAALVRQQSVSGRQLAWQPRVLGLNGAVEALAGVLRRLLGDGVRLQLELQQGSPLVRVDSTGLARVLLNLALNARDAMPQGGTLTLRTSDLILHDELAGEPDTVPPGRYAMLEVQDTGTGIPADVLPHIFERRFTTRRAAGGSGLGLHTVRGIVRRCSGFLAVATAPGRDTRMRVYLPAWQGAPAEAAAAATPPEPAAAGGTVLLVEDEDVLRRVIERALLRQGWRVLAASTAEAALDLLDGDAAPPLVAVVSDLLMPGMDGASLLRAVRDRLGRPDLPAVLVSGYPDDAAADPALRQPGAGATRFLANPFQMRDLRSVLAAICG